MKNEVLFDEIKRSMSDTWKQNAQNNLWISLERMIVDMRHILNKASSKKCMTKS
jgi:hypothetical protein